MDGHLYALEVFDSWAEYKCVARAEAYLVDLQSNDSDGGDVGHQKRQAPVTRPDWQPCASEVWS